ncbi:PepSY-associated TM helix domain-containing protein [uncultured Jatrophihabitans sp.]|uniref:PepSY-associated TM helix domain-containing protein n=1 Tax=uncultured Jatrophihabitans sp. TaxID=1610747 RepID=UPI0035C9C16E
MTDAALPIRPATAPTAAPDIATKDPAPSRPSAARGALRGWWRRRPVHRGLVLLHRWPGLVLGLLLVVECTSGAVLLYDAEIFRATNGGLYRHTAAASPITPDRAVAVVKAAHPGFDAIWVAEDKGVLVVGDPAYHTQWFVDPGTGRINGHGSLDTGFMGLLVNLHDCAFSCEGYPGYQPWFDVEVWKAGPTFLDGITRGGLILGVVGLSLILLVATSVKIWWPGRKRLKQRLVVRRGRGRFARDYDLHNVIGAVALPFLLMWGITGAAFEFPVVENTWLALTGGDKPATETYAVTPNPAAAGRPRITTAQATDAALAEVPGRVSFVGLPTKDAPYYEVDIITSYASSEHRAIYRGDAYVYLDAHDATNVHVADEGTGPAANRFYDKYLEPTHFGWNVNAWWRAVWAVLGLAPLALMVTGVSTWWFRRGVRRRRERARAERRTAA